MGTYIGHTSEEGRQQLLIDHLKGTSLLAERFASIFDAAEWGKMAGLYHDIGKYSAAFQQRILEEGPRVDHSTAGALLMKKIKNVPLAFCIASHHSGLLNTGTRLSKTDDGTLKGRLKKELKGKLDYSAYRQELPEPLPIRKAPAFLYGKDKFYYSFFIRMLFFLLSRCRFLGYGTIRERWQGAARRIRDDAGTSRFIFCLLCNIWGTHYAYQSKTAGNLSAMSGCS